MPHQPSQDLEARFSVFLNPIRDLTKNWEVDIAKYLEDYLVELSEIQITFDGGVTVMNFAEAAMLIQGSATVYSKKVEFLWQMVLQMLDLLSSKRNLDLGDEESHKTGATGRSSKSSPILNFERVNKGSIGKNIDLKLEDEVDEKKSEFKFLPAVPLHLVEKESEKSTTHVTLYLKNKEPFGNKDDYRINRSYLAPSGLLCLDLPLEFLQQNLGQKVVSDGEANESVAGFFNNDSVLDEPVVLPEVNEEAVPDVDMAEDDVDHGGGIENNEEVENMEVDAPMDLDPGEDLPPENPVLNDEGNDPVSESVEETLDKDPNEVETLNGRYGLRRKVSKEKIVDIIKLTDPLKPLIPILKPQREDLLGLDVYVNPFLAVVIRRCFKQKKSRTRSKALKEVDNLAAKTISVEEFITKDLARLIANNNNNNSDSKLGPNVNAKLLQELTNENKKKQEKVKKEKLKDLPHENEDFGDEKGSVEQAGMAAVEGGDIEDYDDNDAIPNLDFENIDDGNNFDLPEPHPNSDIETPFGIIRIGDDDESDGNSSRTLNDSMLYEPGSDYEALVQKWVSDYIANAQEHVVSSDLGTKGKSLEKDHNTKTR
ncbi:Condensin-2 complex subunit H2 [Armadillidium vulgare]|nr:Condensin-2 complex subunit H2 [Armadillidium vulgare]